MDLVQVGARWLHLVATVAMIGYYAVLGVLVLPALRQAGSARALGETIAAMERRALPIIVGSLVAFLATGVYLMGADTRYSGVGEITDSWSTLLLVKHVVVAVMVALGVYIDAIIVRRLAPPDAADQDAAARWLMVVAAVMTGLGLLVLYLTAAAQAS